MKRSSLWKARELFVDGRVTELFDSMVGKQSSLERIDQEGNRGHLFVR